MLVFTYVMAACVCRRECLFNLFDGARRGQQVLRAPTAKLRTRVYTVRGVRCVCIYLWASLLRGCIVESEGGLEWKG